jgi:hypothetical protein
VMPRDRAAHEESLHRAPAARPGSQPGGLETCR